MKYKFKNKLQVVCRYCDKPVADFDEIAPGLYIHPTQFYDLQKTKKKLEEAIREYGATNWVAGAHDEFPSDDKRCKKAYKKIFKVLGLDFDLEDAACD